MSRRPCATPLSLATLAEYWLGDLDETAEAPITEHLLGCDQCSAALQQLAQLGAGIRALVRRGSLQAVVDEAFLGRLAVAGLRVREYAVARNGSVFCTVRPDDDLLIARLEAPLAGVERLDLRMLDAADREMDRMQDIPFDRAATQVLLASNMEQLRQLPRSTIRMQLVAVEPGGPHVLGEYTFNHTPWTEN
jgi:hypothetical protein